MNRPDSPSQNHSQAESLPEHLLRRIHQQIETWRADLINLARTNRLLYFKPTRVTTLEITEPDASVLINVLFETPDKGLRIRYTPADQDDPEFGDGLADREIRANTPNEAALARSLRELSRRSTQEYLDRGIWTLYFGVGQLEWIDQPNQSKGETEKIFSPILLVPVELFQEGAQSQFFVRRSEEDIALNPALVVKLQHDHGLDINLPDNIDEDDIESVFSFINGLISGEPDWQIIPKVVLSLFSFHKEAMYRDLQNNEKLVASHELIQSLALENDSFARFEFDPVPIDSIDESVAPETLCSILDADASQRQAILAAKAGKSFIMDGPPGTGKSQTIANIIAELLTQEKTVLFVSEKAAALEVVYKRLADTKLDDFILELHSHKATRKEVAKRLGKSILNHPSVPDKMPPDSISRLTNRRKELTDYALALNEIRSPIGRTLHNVLGVVSKLQSLPQALHPKMDPNKLSAELLGDMVSAAELISRSWKPVDEQDCFLWRDLIDSELNAARKVTLVRLLESALKTVDELERVSNSVSEELFLKKPPDLPYVVALLKIEQLLSIRPDVFPKWLTIEDLDPIEARIRNLKDQTARLKSLQAELELNAGPKWRDIKPNLQESYQKTIKSISANGAEWNPSGGMKLKELCLQADFFESTEKVLTELRALVPELAAIFLDRIEVWSLDRISKLAQIGAMTTQPYLPEKSWIDIGQVGRLREISFRCREAVLEYHRFADSLKEIFLPSILDLSLDRLCVRFEKYYKGLRYFNKSHWKDRKILSAHCVSGKFRKFEKSRLRSALAWKKSKENFEYISHIDGQHLGSFYWRGLDTDFKAIDSALDIAEKGAAIAGLDFNLEQIQNLLALDSSRPPRLLILAGRIDHLLKDWQEGADKENINRFWLIALEKGLANASALNRDYRELCDYIKEINALLTFDLDLSTLSSILDNRINVFNREGWFANSYQQDQDQLGNIYQGPETDWNCLDRSINWANEMRDIFRGPLIEKVAKLILSASPREDELDRAVKDWAEKNEQICGLFEPLKSEAIFNVLNGRIENIRPYISNLLDTIDDIGIWDAFIQAKLYLKELGLEIPVDYCIAERIHHKLVPDIILRSILEVWIDNILTLDKRLKYLSAADRDSFVQEFCRLDKELIKRSTSRVIEKCNSRRPKTMVGASGIILREAEKQRKHMPIRTLIERTGPIAQAIKPCFMMSPLSVSQFLPATIKFDYVIFDEASQVKPADAINCIYRGNNLIVAGDQKQLPPTTFFERTQESDDDSYDEESPDQFQSILDKCKATGTFSSIPLCWHYRSQHEDLIAFSNYSFYEHRLITFPCAQTEADDLGIELFHVGNGIYRRGTSRDNYEEAWKVVDRVRFHCERHPQRSLGVVAFSEAQAFLIETLIQQEAMRSPHIRMKMTDDRLNGIFIKNLETVQGDERDTIIFSVGYGKDEFGKFTLNFGPINKPEGWRRLNVAITRARRRIEVVSSILPEDFPADIANRSVSFLRKYLEYAARKDHRLSVLAMKERATDVAHESPFEEEVARVIENWGYSVVPQVGCAEFRIDLGVRHPLFPSRYILGIECDGAMYHSSKVARDRDRLRQEVLEGLGWILHRIWGPSWYRHRSQQEDILKRVLQRAVDKEKSLSDDGNPLNRQNNPDCIRKETNGIENAPTTSVDLNKRPSWAETYKKAYPSNTRYSKFDIHSPLANPEVDRIIKSIIVIEAPVHFNRIVQRVKEAWGIARAGNRVNEAIRRSLRRLQIPPKGVFYGNFSSYNRVRLPNPYDPDTERTIEEVPVDEIALAMKNLISDAKAINRNDLVRAVSRLFGWERCGDSIRHKLLKVVSRLSDISEEGENIVILKKNGS